MCNVVKNNYGDDRGGFIGGQVYKYTGFVSDEGSFDSKKMTEDHLVIMTYWQSFEQHEKSHADEAFKNKFTELAEFCDETYELGYKDALYVGAGNEKVVFHSDDAANPAKFYLNAAPAHTAYPTRRITLADADKMALGSPETSNERVINKLIVNSVLGLFT